MRDLSVLIAARNEEWLNRTVADVLAHREADTEVIVVLDGTWPSEPLPQDPDVRVFFQPTPIGQRAATNLAARLSSARYVMKLDAHCSVAQGFDRVLLEAAETLGPRVTQVPAQKNLHVYNWVCRDCGLAIHMGPTRARCERCQSPQVYRDVVWTPKGGSTTVAWRFDRELVFQYWKTRRDPAVMRDTLSLLGACWFVSRDQYWALDGLDERHGSWGQVGTEVACKTWLSGGRLVCNTATWFAHMFRVGGIPVPYPGQGESRDRARVYSRRLWMENRWPGQIRDLASLIEQFDAPGWSAEDIAAVRWRKEQVA